MIEGLERRRLMSGDEPFFRAYLSIEDGYTIVHEVGATGGRILSGGIELTEEAAVRDGLTVIRYGDGVGLFASGAAGNGTRAGVFELPSVKADGSSRVVGTSGDDVIIVEAATGVDEVAPDNDPADHAYDFLNLVDPTTGKRYVTTTHELARADETIETLEGFIEGDRGWIEAYEATDAENGNDAHAEQIADLEAHLEMRLAQVARLRHTQSLVADGQFIRYTLEGVYDYYVQVVDGSPSIPRVTVDAGAGSDVVTISPNVPMKATVYGGSGGDTITTGKRQTNVFAGGGKDKLVNRSTKGAVLDGGQSSDRYYNNASAQVQIVGRNDGDVLVVPGATFEVQQTLFVRPSPLFSSATVGFRAFLRDVDGATFLMLEPQATPA